MANYRLPVLPCADMAAMLDGHCTLYDVLKAKEDATVDEIKAAFKRRALEVHPDKGGSKDWVLGFLFYDLGMAREIREGGEHSLV